MTIRFDINLGQSDVTSVPSTQKETEYIYVLSNVEQTGIDRNKRTWSDDDSSV